jgi:predicted hotdog family 3-hydroxylacyl-ACP dehydratase
MTDSPLFKLPIDASEFMPHKSPMLLVDRIIEFDDEEKSSVIEASVKHDNIFLNSEGNLEETALIEIMAQAAAAQHGFNLAREEKKEEKGFIVGIRKFVVSRQVQAGDSLIVEVKLGPEIESLSVVYCTVRRDTANIASAELTVWHG